MSGFQFPPPPPPPPRKVDTSYQASRGDGSRGRGRGRAGGRGGWGSHHPSAGVRDVDSNNGPYQPSRALASSSSIQPNHASPATGSNVWSSFQQSHQQSVDAQWQDRRGPRTGPYEQTNRADQRGPSGHFLADRGDLSQERHDTSGPTLANPLPLAGQKRKLGTLNTSSSGAQAAPSVPTFGTPIIPTTVTVPEAKRSQDLQQRPGHRASNALGLIPTNDDALDVSSDEDVEDKDDDVDEEAMFSELGAKLTFEHNGMMMSLNSQADLARWKEERIRNFPTRSRMSAKLDEKRQLGEMRQSLLLRASLALRRNDVQALDPDYETSIRDAPKTGQAHISSADEAAESAAPIIEVSDENTIHVPGPDTNPLSGRNVEEQDARIEPLPDAERPEASDAVPKDHEEQADLISDQINQPETGKPTSESDDEPPETATTKAEPPEPSSQAQVCRYFATRGQCRNGDNCRYKHERLPSDARAAQANSKAPRDRLPDRANKVAAPSGRRGVHQALLEQEESTYNQKALEVIKHLGKIGFFAQAA